MSTQNRNAAQRRQFLKWLSASPLLALPGVPFAQQHAKRPDPMIWTPTTDLNLIASPKDAINVFDFEPVMRQKVPPQVSR